MSQVAIFTDGAAKGNPGPGGYGAVISYGDRVQEIGGKKAPTTNNEMELRAVVEALKALEEKDAEIHIYSDSKYVVDGATGWVYSWIRNNWKTKAKTDVLHKELWEELLTEMKGKEITWHKISGHVDLVGNECADRIASNFGDGKKVTLYDGPTIKYPHNIADISYDEGKENARREARKRQGAKAYSYVSMVDGKIEVHKTWPECEARVKGASNPKYKKALSKEEETAIIEEFKGLV